ncbi:MAG: DUF21 domain-containing protein [Planctomycetales bacterium]|nr:DUF21 domain-containing protein [Planctomycetales bacterium]NIM09032.1 DUF21 domain-containing protein [Planctomycetales bacterium]NIN08495.1 DUF21 domain-containing protein [Planctomycetales bacterium]NIN77629.1 DUF21 domain-containing protein [Planctomycetales bacterium]NIO34792.1 DUF21 domain-containing protein [Planctomycetales bacterium]
MLELIFYVVIFISLSGLMAAVEAAILSMSPAEVEELSLRQAWGAGALKTIRQRLTQAIVVLVLFTNTINVLGPLLTGRIAIQLYGDVAIAPVAAILTLGTIIFSEIIPKSIGAHYAPLISRFSAPAIRFITLLLYPIVVTLEGFSKLFMSGERRIGTESQIRSLVTLGRRAGYIEPEEGQLIRRAFTLNDRTARDIMTPLEDVVSVAATSTTRQAATHVFRHAYSRYPVFGKSADEIQGLVMSRDILQALTEGKDSQPVTAISRDCLVVSAGLRSDQLLVRFRDARIHLAVVQDQQSTVGVVTLEDVLEELVGDIEDEKD